MFGSDYFKIANGTWDHVGYLAASGLPNIGTGVYRKGTLVDQKADNEHVAVLATGRVLGLITQDIDENGLDNDAGFKNFTIGKLDNPIKRSVNRITARRMAPGSHLEYEGLGAALPGNLVATSGTGAIASNTARGTELSVLNGCIMIAQSGDIVSYHLLKADLVPVADAGNLRILVEKIPNSYTKA